MNRPNALRRQRAGIPDARQTDTLKALFNQGQLAQVATLAQSMTMKYPDFAFGWKAFGTALLQMGHSAEALAPLERAIGLAADDAQTLSNLATALLSLAHPSEAERRCRQAIRLQPEFAPAHYNLGNALKDQGRLEDAVCCFRTAIRFSNSFPEAYRNLASALRDLARGEEAEIQYRQALRQRPHYTEVHIDLGNLLRSLGRPAEAITAYGDALKLQPAHASTWNSLAVTLAELGRLDAAEAAYQRALALKPDYAPALNNLGVMLQAAGRLANAEAVYRQAAAIQPRLAQVHTNLGTVLQELGRLDEAEAAYRRAVETGPDFAGGYSNLGSVLMEIGKTEEAEKALTHALDLAPADAIALATALQYLPYRPDEPRYAHLDRVYAGRESLPVPDRVKIGFAVGKARESAGDFEAAFSAYDEANRLHHQRHGFDEAEDEQFQRQTLDCFTPALMAGFAALAAAEFEPDNARVPIFIVGMPRSGTTLIEQILASHPALFGAGELDTLPSLAAEGRCHLAGGADTPTVLCELRRLGRAYVDHTWRRAPTARFITDKLPGNYRHLGLIHLMLPQAKIVHAMRDPIDTCFSCYATKFRIGHEYAYDLSVLGRHFLRYRQLMRHWHAVLPPGRIVDLRYEDNVANPEREARRLLDHLGLPWNPACLRFHETERAVSTASVAQVRQPIYTSSVARWKHFERQLQPLVDIIRAD